MAEYTAVVYQTTTGRVLYDVDLAAEPSWADTLNGAQDSWNVVTPVGTSAQRDRVREWAERWFCSVAVLWDGQVVQAGPITQNPDFVFVGGEPCISVTGKGFWELLNQRVLRHKDWNPAAAAITDTSADLTINDSLPNIAITIVTHATSMTYVAGSGLPVDIPALGTTDGNTRTYHGYEMASAGQRLQELTQVTNGPDVFFRPYMITVGGNRYVRHEMRVGTPYLVQTDQPLFFDLGGAMVDIGVSADSSPLVTSSFVKGSGNETAQLVGYAASATLTTLGWPVLDQVDSSHASATEPSTLNSWAAANVAQFGRKVEQWKPRILLDSQPLIGSYVPGHFARYAVNNHPWVLDGIYTSRILGRSSVSSDDAPAMVEHQIEAIPSS